MKLLQIFLLVFYCFCARAQTDNSLVGRKIGNSVINEHDIIFGNKDADIIVIEYFGPTCPHCANYTKHLFPEIKKLYIDTGKIAYVIREVISGRQDIYASNLMRCKGNAQDYMKFKEVLMNQQSSWAYNKKSHEILTNIGQIAGLTAQQYSACTLDKELGIVALNHSKELMKEQPGRKFIDLPMYVANGFAGSNAMKMKEFIEKSLNEKSAKQEKASNNDQANATSIQSEDLNPEKLSGVNPQ